MDESMSSTTQLTAFPLKYVWKTVQRTGRWVLSLPFSIRRSLLFHPKLVNLNYGAGNHKLRFICFPNPAFPDSEVTVNNG